MRTITYAAAIREAIDVCLDRDPRVFIIGEGVPDPKGTFGTTIDLVKKYGSGRVMDMPVSENGLTGICIGAAIRGMKPILNHQRVDFSLLSFDQIVNNAAKWFVMFGGKQSVPIVIRMIIGRGWGQGSQHSQSLQASFAHIPGLKVVMPATAYDAKGMLVAAVEDKNPVIYIDHRWLHFVKGIVPEGYYKSSLSQAKVIKKGKDVTIVASSFMLIEAIRAEEFLKTIGISVELIDPRSISPIDTKTIYASVKKTGKLIVADTGFSSFGFASEVVSLVSKNIFSYLVSAPLTITLPDIPTPTSHALAKQYYPTFLDIIDIVCRIQKVTKDKVKRLKSLAIKSVKVPSDIPDSSFTGPF